MNDELHPSTLPHNRLSRERLEREFKKIYDSYAKLLFYISFRIVNNVSDAEDAVNEAFLNFFNNYYEVKNIKYYLVTSVKNISYNILIKKNKQNIISIEENNIILEDPSSNSGINNLLDDFRVFLNEEEIEILLDHIIYCMTFTDIAKQRNKTRFSVASKYRRIIEKIKLYYLEVRKNEKENN